MQGRLWLGRPCISSLLQILPDPLHLLDHIFSRLPQAGHHIRSPLDLASRLYCATIFPEKAAVPAPEKCIGAKESLVPKKWTPTPAPHAAAGEEQEARERIVQRKQEWDRLLLN